MSPETSRRAVLKKILTLLVILVLATSSVMAADNHYIQLTPAGMSLTIFGDDYVDDYYSAGVSYTGYFFGGERSGGTGLSTSYASASGYVPRRYITPAAEETVAPDPVNTIGINMGLDVKFEKDLITGLFDEGAFDDFKFRAQGYLGIALRQPLGDFILFYENAGLTMGTSVALGGYVDAGMGLNLGHFLLNAGARVETGAYLPTDDLSNIDFADAEFALTVTPYVTLGVSF